MPRPNTIRHSGSRFPETPCLLCLVPDQGTHRSRYCCICSAYQATKNKMLLTKEERQTDLNPQETSEWLEALEQILEESGPDRAAYLLAQLQGKAQGAGVQSVSPQPGFRLCQYHPGASRKCHIPAIEFWSGASKA